MYFLLQEMSAFTVKNQMEAADHERASTSRQQLGRAGSRDPRQPSNRKMISRCRALGGDCRTQLPPVLSSAGTGRASRSVWHVTDWDYTRSGSLTIKLFSCLPRVGQESGSRDSVAWRGCRFIEFSRSQAWRGLRDRFCPTPSCSN